MHNELTGDKQIDYRVLLTSDQFFIKNSLLYKICLPKSKKRQCTDGLSTCVLAVPKRYEHSVLTSMHSKFGHYSGAKLFDLARLYIYMKGLYEACFDTAKACITCQQCNILRNRQVPPLNSSPIFAPGEVFYIDHLIFSAKTKAGNVGLLIMIDSYSGFTYLEPVPDVGMVTTAKVLVKRLFSLHPEWRGIVSDRGAAFKSKGIALLNQMTGVKHFFSSSLHPQGHGLVENMVLQVNRLLPKYAESNDIESVLPLLEYILHVNVNSSLGFSPYEILRGKQPSLYLHAEFINNSEPIKPVNEYITWLRSRFQMILKDVDQNILHSRLQQKDQFDKRNKTVVPTFVEGQKVWLEKKRANVNANVNTHKIFCGPFYITKIVSRESTFQPSEDHPYPTLHETAIGKSYELTDCQTGKTLRSLIPARRLKPYISAEHFENKHPPLVPIDEDITSNENVAADSSNTDRPITTTPIDNSRTSLAPGWEQAKNIVRFRKKQGTIEYLVRFLDNTAHWCSEDQVSEELIRRYYLKRSALRRRRQKKSRDAFRDD